MGGVGGPLGPPAPLPRAGSSCLPRTANVSPGGPRRRGAPLRAPSRPRLSYVTKPAASIRRLDLKNALPCLLRQQRGRRREAVLTRLVRTPRTPTLPRFGSQRRAARPRGNGCFSLGANASLAGSAEPTARLGRLLPETNACEVCQGAAPHPSLPDAQPPALPRHPLRHGVGLHPHSAPSQPCTQHRENRDCTANPGFGCRNSSALLAA